MSTGIFFSFVICFLPVYYERKTTTCVVIKSLADLKF